jgi:hypothetical protein
MFGLLAMLVRSDLSKNAELLVLRHENLWGVRTRLVPVTCVDWSLMVIGNDDHPCPSACST